MILLINILVYTVWILLIYAPYILLFYSNSPIFMENVNLRLVHFSRRYWWHRFSLINDSKTHKSFYRDNLTCSWKKIRLWQRANHFIYLKLILYSVQYMPLRFLWCPKYRDEQFYIIDSFEFHISSSKTLK